jgi:hypothetical protein
VRFGTWNVRRIRVYERALKKDAVYFSFTLTSPYTSVAFGGVVVSVVVIGYKI